MREIKITKILLNVNSEEQSKFLFKRLTADNQNRILEESEFNSEGKTVRRQTYRHSDSGNISEQIEYNPHNELIERITHIENEEGIIYSTIQEFTNGAKTVRDFSFTDLGNAYKTTLKDENGTVLGFEAYVFDEENRMTSEFESNANNEELFKLAYEYDANNNVISESQYSSGELDFIKKHFYNIEGMLIKTLTLDKDKVLYSTVLIELDTKNRVIKRTTSFFKYNNSDVEEFEYDQNDNIISNKVTNNNRVIFTTTSKFDDSNQLIESYVIELDINGNFEKHERLLYEFNS